MDNPILHWCQACDRILGQEPSNPMGYCAECLKECEHADMDEGQCLDCGKDRREDLAADAYDRWKDARYE